ncbi:DUF308 domain-containing protein [Botrimarina sp.]|uniref:HdeD family acid-resistance protein n=1 Tax=Botrimarina sp. TaxID=2795802 RepID=UPI0032ECEAF1
MIEQAPPSDAAGLTDSDREALRSVAGLWWVLLLRGVLMIALGAYALLMPGVTLKAYVWVLGLFVLLDGLLAIVAGVAGWDRSRWWAVARGVLGVVVGLFVMAHPALVGVVAITVIVVLLALQLIINGVLEIAAAVRERSRIRGEWWLVLGGVLSILLGVILLASPLLAGAMLVRVLGVFAIIAGVALLVAAFRLRSFGKRARP